MAVSSLRYCAVESNLLTFLCDRQVVFPHEANIKAKASELGIESTEFHSLCQNEQMRDAILKDINATGKKAGFKSIEVLQCVVLSDEEWTPQNEMLTAGESP